MANNRKNRFQAQLRKEGEAPDTTEATIAPRGQAYALSTSVPADDLVLPTEAREELGDQLFHIARRYVGARRRSGEALLEAARALAEARQVAAEGTWHAFLRITETSQDTAESLINIATRAQQQASFAHAITTGRVNQTVAGLLARPSIPQEVVGQVLADDKPLRVADVQRVLRQARQHASRHAFVDNVDNVDTPNNSESSPHERGATTVVQMFPPLSVGEQHLIQQLVARVDHYLQVPHDLSAQDWQHLTPLARSLRALLAERGDGM